MQQLNKGNSHSLLCRTDCDYCFLKGNPFKSTALGKSYLLSLSLCFSHFASLTHSYACSTGPRRVRAAMVPFKWSLSQQTSTMTSSTESSGSATWPGYSDIFTLPFSTNYLQLLPLYLIVDQRAGQTYNIQCSSSRSLSVTHYNNDIVKYLSNYIKC